MIVSTLKQHLTQAALHLDKYFLDSSLGVDAVVLCHVLDELIKLHQLMHGTGEPLTKGVILSVLVLIQNVINHNAIRFKLFGTIADAKVVLSAGLMMVSDGFGYDLHVIARYCLTTFS